VAYAVMSNQVETMKRTLDSLMAKIDLLEIRIRSGEQADARLTERMGVVAVLVSALSVIAAAVAAYIGKLP